MSHPVRVFLLLNASLAAVCWAQRSPGYLDPEPILRAAEQAIGVANLKCVTFSGTGYAGAVGQQKEAGINIDWPRIDALANYTRTMNWDAKYMIEEFDRPSGKNPASWKYGSGWKGGTPLQKNSRQKFVLSGNSAWHFDGPGSQPVASPPDDAERWQVDMWINPHGFLKAARMPGANPKAFWRWELGEEGRDGATKIPEKVTIVAITMFGKYKVDATINQEHMVQRIHTYVVDPVLGDMNYEHEFANENYTDLGNGIKFPTRWHHHAGWDDNYGTLNITAGHNAFGGDFRTVKANACPAPEVVPAAVRQASFAPRVEVQKLADGVYLMGGGSHNSVAVEFKDYIAVVEAPLDETRSLAVIEEIVKLIPNKPIRFLVNTHQHFDHIGGLRTYAHIGATTITHQKNFTLYLHDVMNYTPRTLDPDLLTISPPTELTEGYQYETVRENYHLTDSTRDMHISYVQPLAHVEGMLMVYLPQEKIAIEADLFDPATQGAVTPANRTFYNHVQRLGLDVLTIVPIHGKPTPWGDFLKIVGPAK